MAEDHKDPPIETTEFTYGVRVVDIGDARVARGFSRRPYSACRHRRMVYDTAERRIWCEDCERNVEPFDAFMIITENIHAAHAGIARRRKELDEAEKFQARSLAVKALDEVWRGRTMVPACPTCGHGLLPEMFAKGVGSTLGRDYAAAKLRAKKEATDG